MQAEPIIVERLLDAPVDTVWQAITDKNKMKEWYFDFEEFKPEVGFEFQWYGDDGQKKWLHAGRITEVIKGKKLSYSWRYPEYEGDSLVTFELFPEGNKTRLKLTHSGLHTFPVDTVTGLRRENFVAGWNDLIGRSLPEYISKTYATK